MYLLLIVLIILIFLIVGVYQKYTNRVCCSKKRLDGKTVIVTGGTAGMGLEIALDLAKRGAHTIIACPFEDEGIKAKRHIIESTKNHNVSFKYLDLRSLASVRKFASEIIAKEDRLDILVNNAGVLAEDNMQTADGMGSIMQVNYFGPFLLTLLLLPLLKKTGIPSEPSRIVNTGSVYHWFGTVDFNKMNGFHCNWFKSLRLTKIYANSKLCVILFTHELAKRLHNSNTPNVIVNCVDPGAVGTNIFKSYGKFIGYAIIIFLIIFFKTPYQGAQTALHVALDSKAGQINGKFFKNCKLSKAKRAAYDDSMANKLWRESLMLVKMSEHEQKYFIGDLEKKKS